LFKRLDVGCGNRPTGDVNIDLFFGQETLHLDSLKPRKIKRAKKNPIKCDAHFLPLRNRSFDTVYSSHLLEHVKNPSKVLIEMLRVTKHKVIFVVPHRFFRYQKRALKRKTHKNIFTSTSIKKWLKPLKKYHIQVKYYPFPNKIIRLFFLPSEIKVEIWK